MAKRYYVAYGSNLNVLQMQMRCPTATVVGTAVLEGWELLFKGSKTGSYLTIEQCPGEEVPVAVWAVTAKDEAALDRYEGCPTFYYKKDIKVKCKQWRKGTTKELTAFVYIMHEDRPIGIPSRTYLGTCADGYYDFNFDDKYLAKAYLKSKERYNGDD